MKLIPLVTLVVFSLLVTDAYAFGIATDYGSDLINVPITQRTAIYSFRLQNMDDSEMRVSVIVESEDNIARLMNESEYLIPAMSRGVEFLIELSVPNDAQIGNIYNVSFNVKQSGSEDGQITIGQGMGKDFQIRIVSENMEEYAPLDRGSEASGDGGFDYTIAFVGIVVIVALSIAGYLWYRRKQEERNEKFADNPYYY